MHESESLPAELSDATRNFFNQLTPRRRAQPRQGEPIASLMCGGMSVVPPIICLAAFLCGALVSLPDMVRRATIVLVEPSGLDRIGKVQAGWWYVPDVGFWRLVTSGLVLASVGLLISRRKGRPITSLIGFGLNALALLIGYALAFTDLRQW